MGFIAPRFGSLYILETPRNQALCESKAQFDRLCRGRHRVVKQTRLDVPVTIVTTSDGSIIQYFLTLPDGAMRQVNNRSNWHYTMTHILSGAVGERSNYKVNRSHPTGLGQRLKNLWRRYIAKTSPLTVEQLSDIQVEARLKRHKVPYKKVAFEDAGWRW